MERRRAHKRTGYQAEAAKARRNYFASSRLRWQNLARKHVPAENKPLLSHVREKCEYGDSGEIEQPVSGA
jgi:hypothetical protein